MPKFPVPAGVSSLRWSRLRRRALRLICSRLYRDPDRAADRSIVVAGTGRSGTTWLADLICTQIRCRVMFEQVNSSRVPAYSAFNYFHYQRPDEEHPALEEYCRRVLTGDIRDRWIDQEVERVRFDIRLVKEIRANLFLKWLTGHFPACPVIFLVRHPCAVVLSRMQWNWATDGDIEPLLRQDKLVADFLSGKLDAIGRTTSEEGKHAIVWCISNLVPLAQFASGELTVVHYENLVASPRREVPKIFASIGQPFCADVYDRIATPSTTTLRNRRNLAPERRMADWTNALSPEQIRNILDVVEWFGLGHLYGPAVMPVEPHP